METSLRAKRGNPGFFTVRIWIAALTLAMTVLISGHVYAVSIANIPADPAHFLVLTDIHFDPFYSCGNVAPCPLVQKLRQTNPNEWRSLFAVYDKTAPHFGDDCNYSLFVSALTASKEIALAKHAQFALILGDFISHDFRRDYKRYSGDKSFSGYQQFVAKTFQFLFHEIALAYPFMDVYGAVGNNDSYTGDYATKVDGPFFKNLADVWASVVKNNANRRVMQKEFSHAGYYAVNLANQENIRLIVLNTNLFSNKARGKNIAQAATEELNWLHNELQQAKARGQKIFIAMHIPLGIDIYRTLQLRIFTLIEFWDPIYSRRFRDDLQAFTPEISGIFTGHIHSDAFQVLTFNSIQIPSTGTPSVSPIYGNNPGFKIYSYSPKTEQLLDFITYYFPLNQPNATWQITANKLPKAPKNL